MNVRSPSFVAFVLSRACAVDTISLKGAIDIHVHQGP